MSGTPGKRSGKSFGHNGGQSGQRRKNLEGKDMAPRSLRAKRKLLEDCSEEELHRAHLA